MPCKNIIKPGGCPVPSLSLAGYFANNISRASEGEQLIFECNEGYLPIGQRVSLCSNNTWNPDPPYIKCYKDLTAEGTCILI